MYFELSDELCKLLINGMEDSIHFYMFDSSSCSLIDAADADESNTDIYPIPFWDSKSGFNLRSCFINSLPDSEIKDTLLQILHSGRGFFKEFKHYISQDVILRNKWHFYKTMEMRKVIFYWYKDICEQCIPYHAVDLTLSDLLYSDFSFISQTFFDEKVQSFLDTSKKELVNTNPPELSYVFEKVYELRYNNTDKLGLICNSPFNDIVGCIFFTIDEKDNIRVAILDCFFVQAEYQGLGLGSELLSLIQNKLKACNIDWIFVSNFFLTEKVIHILQNKTYKKNSFGYYYKLTDS